MGRRLRIQEADAIQFVTNRTFQERFFLRPSAEVNRIILGCLAREAAKHQVRIFAFVFMSNHFPMLVQALLMNLPEFMRDFQSSVARELNRHHGRKGKFYGRRYSAEPVLDDEAFLDKFEYTLNNPCRSNLVRHIEDWPGISSWELHKGDKPMVGKWLNRHELRRLRRSDDDTPREAAFEEYELELAPPPMWADLSEEEQQRRACELIDAGARELQKERKRRRISCVGPEKVMTRHWSDRPKESANSPRPLCHSSCPKLAAEYREQLRDTTAAYQRAMGRFRKGKSDVQFPHGTIPPGHVRCVGSPPRRLRTAA